VCKKYFTHSEIFEQIFSLLPQVDWGNAQNPKPFTRVHVSLPDMMSGDNIGPRYDIWREVDKG